MRLSRYPIERLRVIPIYPPRIQKIRAVSDISMAIIDKGKPRDFAFDSPPSQRSGRHPNQLGSLIRLGIIEIHGRLNIYLDTMIQLSADFQMCQSLIRIFA
jgi:hypothetical protein